MTYDFLVIDDEESIRGLLEYYLLSHYPESSVRKVATLEECESALRTRSPSLIVSISTPAATRTSCGSCRRMLPAAPLSWSPARTPKHSPRTLIDWVQPPC
jgi:hypothetical protein